MFKSFRLALAVTVLSVAVGVGAVAPPAQAYVRYCGYAGGFSVSANSVTSCPFAKNVARAYAGGRKNPYVYSPTTHRSYQMYCGRTSYRTVVCRGGNNAYVRLRG